MNNVKERNRFLKFAVVGAIGAVIDFGVMNLLTHFLQMELQYASIISFIAAVASNFLWNRFWTFPESKDLPIVPQLVQFSIVSIIGLLVRTPMLVWINNLLFQLGQSYLPPHLYIDLFTPEFFAKNIALATVILIVMMWNFIVNRLWTYKKIK